MHPIRKRRLIIIISVLLCLSVATGLILFALQQNIDLYFTPSQVDASKVQQLKEFRLGGMVEKNSVQHSEHSLEVRFRVTDFTASLPVVYRKVLPALFREGQGVVIEGHLNPQGVVEAHRVLAKHDEKYMPPSIKQVTKAAT